MHRRHASHITVVLSKAQKPPIAARLCVCERDPPAHFAYLVPERIAPRAVSLQARACSASCRSLRFRGPLGARQVMSPDVQLTHGPGRTVALPYFVPRSVYASLRTVQTHLCLCAKYCGVSRRVRTVSFVDDFVVLALTRLHFSPVFPRFVSF